MSSVKELQDRRARAGADIRRMADTLTGDKTDFTAEERAVWDRANADFDALTRDLEQAEKYERRYEERQEENRRFGGTPGMEDRPPQSRAGRRAFVEMGGVLPRSARRPDADEPASERRKADIRDEVRAVALQAWCRRQMGKGLTADHRKACKLAGLDPNQRSIDIRLPRHPGRQAAVSGAKTMLAGAMKKFKIRDAGKLRLRRLEERYGEYDQTGFVAFLRTDSKILDAGTHPIKYLIQP